METLKKVPSVDTIMLCIQAIDAELYVLSRIPENEIHPEQEILFIKYQNAASELKKIYTLWTQELLELTPYNKLTPFQSRHEKKD